MNYNNTFLTVDENVPSVIKSPRDGESMKLVWHDEFDGDRLDPEKWNLFDRMWGKNTVISTVSERNITVRDGNVLMRAWREENGIYSTHRTLTTWDRMSFRYGYMEICAKVPYVPGAFPSFWFQSAHQHRTADYMTEVDVFEPYYYDYIESAMHKWYLRPPTPQSPSGTAYDHDWREPLSYTFPDSKNLNSEYHRYGFGWTREEMYFTVDGRIYASYDITESGDFGQRENKTGMGGFQDPLIVNFTNWICSHDGFRHKEYQVNSESEFPFCFSVDWIRLYQKDGEGEVFDDRIK